MVHSEDEYDEDTQSIKVEEEDEDREEVGAHLIKAFGSTFQSEFQKDIQEVAEQQGSINTLGSLERIQNLKKLHNLSMIAILEPFADNSHLNSYRIKLNMENACCNSNGKIWLFWTAEINLNILESEDQHIIGTMQHVEIKDKLLITIVYAKSKDYLRRHLWDRLIHFSNMNIPWCTIGDFNVITTPDEKQGGIPYNMNKSFEFIATIEACGLMDLGTVRDHEETVRMAEEALIVNNSAENRANLHRINARYIKYLKLEYSILKQKTQLQWFKDGDTNSKYFHAIMRGRRRKLFIHKVCIGNDEWVEGDENIAKAACDHFQNKFTGTEQPINEDILQHIPRMVTPEQNMTLQAMPTSEELQQVVFSMNPNSAPGPDGFSGKFFQNCWDIIKEDILNAVHAFFCGYFIPKFISHASLEIIHGIKKPKKGDKVVIKLDMAKAYDRVSWAFTSLVLRHMGFGEFFIDMVWRIISNNWYSIIVNGTRHGFFHSTRGLKQGDPLSPSLFNLGAEVLSRMLNNLYDNQQFHGFQMHFRGPQINYLSFADDVIIFTSGREESLKLIMETLSTYEDTSDQLINKGKSHFMVPKDTPSHLIDMIQEITGFNQRESPINYLGCPLYIGGQRIIYYSDLVAKVVKKISGWHSRILSFGGKATLVKHVLQSIPIHTMATISPPRTTLQYIKRVTAYFFWGMDKDKKKYHWASWETLSFPYEEGGICVRHLNDVCTSLQIKQWWNFRTKQSLWGQFLKAKYC
ncbi:hypothetical protein MTR67_023581 [Solanum verrucosum]|uniref:Reverse transcriptase domain-containing protein n=1 Tax=Solanum verrucosum TaxID=315347 RepID=A0AAF0QVG5_SOLVR|nr:hypothetical protein MTR67_023581 [Solanum verrucosum]